MPALHQVTLPSATNTSIRQQANRHTEATESSEKSTIRLSYALRGQNRLADALLPPPQPRVDAATMLAVTVVLTVSPRGQMNALTAVLRATSHPLELARKFA